MEDVLEARDLHIASGPAVLLVEDDVMLGRLMTSLLDSAGYRSLTIADHEQIGSAIDRFDPSCVILDGEIDRTGHARSWTDAAAIRRAHPALPVLMFTADADALAEERAGVSRRSHEAGFVGVVPKPFLVEDFLATLKNAIDRSPPASVAGRGVAPEPGGRSSSETTKIDFYSAAVHELKTPLATISGQVQLARRMVPTEPGRARAALDIALQQVERMNGLIGSLQNDDLRRAFDLRRRIVSFDLCEAATEAIKRHEHDATPRLTLDRPQHAVSVRGDPDRVAQILDNLLNNALKYSPAGAPVEITISAIGREAQVRVEDYGIGVAAEERDRMFTAYFRTSRTRDIPGSGLGLYISRRLAEEHGGRLWLDDSTDARTVFALALPLADDQAL